ncbi:MAG: methylated-DNA--[protein]-cysteine S-methyltransferase [Actinomycetota bacterium]|nr:methylated-DNA--[protein]-cysteine S-methyltransferase [Actinomycetota bacterium]
MAEYINKTEFKTKVCKFYCLWKEQTDGIIILFLGNEKRYFKEFIRKIEDKYREKEKFLTRSKKSGEIEEKVTGYLDGKVKDLNLKAEFLTGTPFQRKIWVATTSIPYGKTASYKEVTEIAGYKKAWRAAGTALNKNPVLLIIPCHRIIKSDGSYGSFDEAEKLNLKKYLINLEKNYRI